MNKVQYDGRISSAQRARAAAPVLRLVEALMEQKARAAAPVLRRAATIIAEKGWTSRTSTTARRADGRECDPCDPEATSFCAAGAVTRAGFELGVPACWGLAQQIGELAQPWNNNVARSGDEVCGLLGRVAERLEAGDLGGALAVVPTPRYRHSPGVGILCETRGGAQEIVWTSALAEWEAAA